MSEETQTTEAFGEGERVVLLKKKIQTPDGEIDRLTFREPTAADIVAVGNPVVFNPMVSPPSITFDEGKMTGMMARLSSNAPSVLSRMSPRDWNTAAWVLAPFFVPALD